MAKVTYITHDNKSHTVDVQNGLTVMEGCSSKWHSWHWCWLWWEEWLAQLAMFMSKKNGLINFQQKRWWRRYVRYGLWT